MEVKSVNLILAAVLSLFSCLALAYPTNAERIEGYVQILESGGDRSQQEMLNRLQWSGLSDPALFDVIEKRLLQRYQECCLSGDAIDLIAYHVRALGYSGNEKYRATLDEVKQNAEHGALKRHAGKALVDLPRWDKWLALLPAPVMAASGQSIETATYQQMLDVDNIFVQRLAARAIFHEQNRDAVLLEKAVALVEASYMNANLEEEAEDTVAWLCKAIAVAGTSEQHAFLLRVAEQTPSRKIAKYAKKHL
jgi:hypothetical protein